MYIIHETRDLSTEKVQKIVVILPIFVTPITEITHIV